MVSFSSNPSCHFPRVDGGGACGGLFFCSSRHDPHGNGFPCLGHLVAVISISPRLGSVVNSTYEGVSPSILLGTNGSLPLWPYWRKIATRLAITRTGPDCPAWFNGRAGQMPTLPGGTQNLATPESARTGRLRLSRRAEDASELIFIRRLDDVGTFAVRYTRDLK